MPKKGDHMFNVLTDTKYGKFLVNRNDSYVGKSLLLYGEYIPGEEALFNQIAKGLVVEVGSNIGAHTVPMAKTADILYAFEPQRLVFQTLCANLALNNLVNVYPSQMVVGDGEGNAIVPSIDPNSEANFGGLEIGNWTEGDNVPVCRLDSFPFPRLDFLKIDVEGMELEVLKGGAVHIAKHRPIIFVENDRPEKSAALIGWLQRQFFQVYWHVCPLYVRENFRSNDDDQFGAIVSINILCLPKEKEIKVDLPLVEDPNETWQEALQRAALKSAPLPPPPGPPRFDSNIIPPPEGSLGETPPFVEADFESIEKGIEE